MGALGCWAEGRKFFAADLLAFGSGILANANRIERALLARRYNGRENIRWGGLTVSGDVPIGSRSSIDELPPNRRVSDEA